MSEEIKKIRLLCKEILKDELINNYGSEHGVSGNCLSYLARCAAFRVFSKNEYDIDKTMAIMKNRDDILNSSAMKLELNSMKTLVNEGVFKNEQHKGYSVKIGFHHKKSYDDYKVFLQKHDVLDSSKYKALGFRTCKDSVFVEASGIRNCDYEDIMNNIFDRGGFWGGEISLHVKTKG